MLTIIIFLAVLNVLVFVHEWGHYIAAKKSGMRVFEFALGFPPRIFGWYTDPVTHKKVWLFGPKGPKVEDIPVTMYSFNLLPLGGYCKIKGENGEEGSAQDSFGAKGFLAKVITLAAGVTMNIAFAALIFGFGFIIGLPTDVTSLSDKYARVKGEPAVIIQMVEKESVAERAGLRMGDIVRAIDTTQITDVERMVEIVGASFEKEIIMQFERNGETQSIAITPQDPDGDGKGRIGVSLAASAIVSYPWYIALWKGIVAAISGLLFIFYSLYILAREAVLGHGMAFELSGPVGIAGAVGQSVQLGLPYLINITGMISLSLAAINILPFPALDGGRILFVLIEKIIKKPVPMKYEQIAHTAGFILLLALLVFVTVKDVGKLF